MIRRAARGEGDPVQGGADLRHEVDSEAEAPIRAVLADGDPLARRTVRETLQRDGITVVAEATTGREAVELASFYRPDVIVMDDRVAGIDGLEATRRIHDRVPEVAIVLLAGAPDDEYGLRSLRAGATGYLSKEVELEALPRVLRAVLGGEAAISRRLTRALLDSYRRAPLGGAGLRPVRSPLTDREWEVLDLLSDGAGTEDIAHALVLSTETVRSHLKNLYRKLGVRSREEAVAAARRLRDVGGMMV
jgi:NarL family two-component system response regulator LiaR